MNRLDRMAQALVLSLASLTLAACASTPGQSDVMADPARATAYTDEIFRLSAEADRAYRQSQWLEAARHYTNLTVKVPEDAYAWFRLGNTYAQQGAFDQAIHAYRASLERNATQPKPWFNLSTAYLLNAQMAMTRSWETLRPGDPARALIETRLRALADLMHQRIEDVPLNTNALGY